MNLENFSKRYAVSYRQDSARYRRSAWLEQTAKDHPGFAQLTEKFGGCVFEQGLYRIHLPDACETWSLAAGEAFPEFMGKLGGWLRLRVGSRVRKHCLGRETPSISCYTPAL